MGLDAVVYCTCWKDGLASTPPVPAEWLEIGPGGELLCEREGDLDPDTRDGLWSWFEHGCQHENQWFQDERIGNAATKRWLDFVFRRLPAEEYPLLRGTFTSASITGTVPAASAPGFVAELNRLAARDALASTRILMDGSGAVIMDGIDVWGSIDANGVRSLGTSGGEQVDVEILVDGYDFVVRDRISAREILRTRHLSQQLLEQGSDSTWGLFVFGDWDERRCAPARSSGIRTRIRRDAGETSSDSQPYWAAYYPPALFVTERMIAAAEGKGVFDRLLRVFEASMEVGNPVVWC